MELIMRSTPFRGLRVLLGCSFLVAALAACNATSQQSNLPEGETRRIVALEYGGVPRAKIAENLKNAAMTCWQHDMRFEGLRFSSLTPRSEPESFDLALRPKKGGKSSREADIVIVPLNSSNSGYLVQVRQRGGGADIGTAVERAILNGCN